MTIIKQKNQRVGIFIDAQNLYHSARNLYGANVNFVNVLKEALAGRSLIRAIAYVITTESGEEKVFFEALEKAGIETKTKDLQIFYGGAKKADWDVGIAVDAIRLSSKLDAIVIASGDGDFVPLVEYLKFEGGCQVEVMSFAKSSSLKLTESADDYRDMSEDKKTFLIRKNKGGKKKVNLVKNNTIIKNDKKVVTEKKINKKPVLIKKIKKQDNSTQISRVAKKDIIIDGTEKKINK